MLECLAEVQRTSERASSDICLVNHEARVQAEEHDRRLADFLRQIETARTPVKPRTSALRASTPKVYPEFDFDESPVGRDEVPHPELNSLPHTRSARTEDYDSIETHMGSACNTLPHIGSARTAEITDAFGDTRNTLPHIGSARTVETTDAFGDTRSTLPQIGSARTVDIADAFGDTHNTLPHTSSARTTGSGTRAPGTTTHAFVWMSSLHTKTTGGTVETFNRVPTTLAILYRSRASQQARKSQPLMGQTLPSSGRGLYNSRPSRAIRAGQQENG